MVEIKKGDRVMWVGEIRTVLTEPFTHPDEDELLVVVTSGHGLSVASCNSLKPAPVREWKAVIGRVENGGLILGADWSTTPPARSACPPTGYIWREKQPDGSYTFGVEPA